MENEKCVVCGKNNDGGKYPLPICFQCYSGDKCVVCGKDNDGGKYDDLPVCFECYDTGTLATWLKKIKDK